MSKSSGFFKIISKILAGSTRRLCGNIVFATLQCVITYAVTKLIDSLSDESPGEDKNK